MSLSTSNVSSASGAAAATATSTDKTSLGKNDFLKLLTAQLTNQDPLAPVDNQAFIAQLAQFSSLEQLQNISTDLDSLLTATASSNQLGAASLVGKTVEFKASQFTLTSGTAPAIQVSLPSSGTVSAVIQNASGQVVRTLPATQHTAGVSDLGWNGCDDNGAQLPSGTYTVKLSATAADGTALDAQALSQGVVSGIRFQGTSPQPIVAGTPIGMADVLEITQP